MLRQIILAATTTVTFGSGAAFMVSPAAAQADHIYPYYEHVPVTEPGIGVAINWGTAIGNKVMDGGYLKSLGAAPYAQTGYSDYPLYARRHRYGYQPADR